MKQNPTRCCTFVLDMMDATFTQFLRFICLVCGLNVFHAQAQTDSLGLLTPEQVSEENIAPREQLLTTSRAYSPTRRLEDVASSPFTVFVFTNEDILRNNFSTLVDVLKTLPGVTVSQPGNALEGETFMINGQNGNGTVKILINNVPVKPFVVGGMPIGAQLPVRQAERIEVVYGSATALYGTDACSAVVHIFTKETERPVFALADLGFGNLGYNSLDITFGGKLGRDKNIFRFSMFGSSTVIETRDVVDGYGSTYSLAQYQPTFLLNETLSFNRNYTRNDQNQYDPIIGSLPHESRLFGLNLLWRGLRFNYLRMQRADHSAIGLNPMAVAYSTPSDRHKDLIESFSLGFERQRKRRRTNISLSLLTYAMDPLSSTGYTFPGLASSAYFLTEVPDSVSIITAPAKVDLLNLEQIGKIQDSLPLRRGYSFATSGELALDIQTSFKLAPWFELEMVWMGRIGGGVPYSSFYRDPVRDLSFLNTDGAVLNRDFSVSNHFLAETTLGLGSHFSTKKTKGYASIGGSAGSDFTGVFPRIGIFHQLTKRIGIRGNYSTGIRATPRNATSSSYLFYDDSLKIATPSYSYLPSQKLNFDEVVTSETHSNAEVGLRFGTKHLAVEGTLFWSKATGIVTPGNFFGLEYSGVTGSNEQRFMYGYAGDKAAFQECQGIRSSISLDSLLVLWKFNQKEYNFVWKNRAHFQLSMNQSLLPISNPDLTQPLELQTFSHIFNYPRSIIQWQSSIIAPKFELTIRYFRQSATHSNGERFRTNFRQTVSTATIPKYGTWDFNTRVFLSKNLFVYFQMTNIFDKQYGGIDASASPDDLRFNPQQGRLSRLGINYNLN